MKNDRNTADRPVISRVASLKDFDSVLLGRDLGSVLKEGHVYSVENIEGAILLKDLGEHAVHYLYENHTSISEYAIRGVHCLTKTEYEHQKSIRNDD